MRIPSLPDVDIDIAVAPLIEWILNLGVATAFSCQGDPGTVTSRYDDWPCAYVSFPGVDAGDSFGPNCHRWQQSLATPHCRIASPFAAHSMSLDTRRTSSGTCGTGCASWIGNIGIRGRRIARPSTSRNPI